MAAQARTGAGTRTGRPEQGNLFPPAVELGSSPAAVSDPAMAYTRRQVVWLAIAVLCWTVVVVARLAYLQVVRRSFFEEKARLQQQRTVEVRASRGLILDRRGHELAISVPVDSICAMPAEIPDPEAVGSILSQVLGLPRRELVKKLAVGHGFCWIARLVEPEQADRVRALGLKGIYFQKESKRYYPKGTTAAHLIGAVGLDQVGLAGVEQAREEELHGRPGKMVVSADARQRQFAGALSQQPDPGVNLILTIDERIQYIAERELHEAIVRTRAAAGSIVILEPATGAVLAVANYPTFNPNQPVRSPTDIEKRRNFAITSAFEPGSTFKLVTVAAALEEKVTRPEEVIDCQMGSIVVAGHRIRDHKPFGRLTVEQIIANSSDVGAIKLGMRLGERRMYQYIRRFGFGRPTGVELPGEAMGLTRPAEQWSKISIGAISMGQEIGVTAMQMAQAVGVIANGGMLVPPRVLEATFETGGKPVVMSRSPGRQVLSPETAIHMKRMMEMVMLNGTGKLARLEGYTAGGKTGTAQKIDPRTGAYSKTDYVASFVGFAPLNNPALVVAIVLDAPRGLHSGGGVCAPMFPRVAAEVLRYLQVPQELPVDPSLRRKRTRPDPQLLAEVSDFTPDNGLEGERREERGERRDAGTGRRGEAERGGGEPVLLAFAHAAMPDFYGKPVRQVVEQATAIGLALNLKGSGIARRQFPAPGSPLPSGARVTIEFER
ncbi:MAG: transpeptidase family protein [Acidobacteria bacterium]|nr:transpeptidase family protein [Acidobacteriota bacterium]